MEKLVKIQQALKAPKTSDNKFGGYKYRSAEQILQAVKPLLDGAFLNINDEIVVLGTDKYNDEEILRTYVKATVTFVDGDWSISSSAFAREDDNLKGMTHAQITGAASSYARKYALNALFAIDNTDDDMDSLNTGTIKMMTPAQKATLETLKIDWDGALKALKLSSVKDITESDADVLIKMKLKKANKNG